MKLLLVYTLGSGPTDCSRKSKSTIPTLCFRTVSEMGKKRGLPNWVPDGWKVEVRTLKKGKK
ncbi:hypothetical protein KY285_001609 [Solanum tuberosum]|nr:hypothetical protein KY289_001885 [Solanum tuberosum]KAH0765738.1 hypothetical protein KY285_001609 [Solanum tuberosum]